MSDRTPTDVSAWLDILRGEVAKHHDRINDHGTKLIGLVGADGRNGWRSAADKRLNDLEDDVKETGKVVTELKVKMAFMVGIASLFGSLAGGGIVAALMRGGA